MQFILNHTKFFFYSLSFSSSYFSLHPSVVTECQWSWFSLPPDRFSSLLVIPSPMLPLLSAQTGVFISFFLRRRLPRAIPNISHGVFLKHLAGQYGSNAPLFPGKDCTDSTSNSNFLWLTTAPWLSPPLNPLSSVHCQHVYYFSLNAARSYLLRYYISCHFCYCDYFVLLVETQIPLFIYDVSQLQVINILLHWHSVKKLMQLGCQIYFYETLPRKLPQIYYFFFPHNSLLLPY